MGVGVLLFSYLVLTLLFSSDSVTQWTAARQASLSFLVSRSLLKLMSIESMMPSNPLILCHPLPVLSLSQHQGVFYSNSLKIYYC